MTELTAVALASQSPRRLALLRSLDLDVVVVHSRYTEHDGGTAGDCAVLASRHALGKADAAEAGGPPMLVAADTIVDVDGAAFGKPRDDADAKRMLRTLSDRWHTVHTAFAVVDRANGKREHGVESSRVRFSRLDDAAIDRYVATGEPRDKAGAYGIQGRGALLVERVDGDFYTVMGLPLLRLAVAFRQLGYEVG